MRATEQVVPLSTWTVCSSALAASVADGLPESALSTEPPSRAVPSDLAESPAPEDHREARAHDHATQLHGAR